jgi:hypothetical protein
MIPPAARLNSVSAKVVGTSGQSNRSAPAVLRRAESVKHTTPRHL